MEENSNEVFGLGFILILFITILFWAWAFLGIKVALNELSPEDLTILRFLIADFIFIPYLVSKRNTLHLKGRDIPGIFVLGVGGITVYHLCLNFGEIYITSGVASLIISTAPVFIFIGSIIFLNEQILKIRVFGTVFALLGVITILLSGENAFNVENYTGAFAVFIAALSATFYTIYGKSLFRRYSPSVLTASAITAGTIPLIFLLTPEKLSHFSRISSQTWLSVLFLGICSTVIGYQGWYYILEKMDASRAAVMLQAIPVVAVASGVAFLGESINAFFILGAFMVILGVYLVNKK